MILPDITLNDMFDMLKLVPISKLYLLTVLPVPVDKFLKKSDIQSIIGQAILPLTGLASSSYVICKPQS